MSKECSQHEVNNILTFFFCENEYALWWPLQNMSLQNLFKKFESLIGLHLPFDHSMQYKVHYSHQGANFFI